MADLTITTSQLVFNGGPFADGFAGEALTAGQSVYLNSADGRWYKAKASGTIAQAGQGGYSGTGGGLGIALDSAPAVGGHVRVALAGSDITLGAGAAPAAGTAYVVSSTFGGIAPTADVVASASFRSVIALGKGTNAVRVVGVCAEAAIP